MKFGYLVIIYNLVEYKDVDRVYFFSSYGKARSFLKNYVKNYNEGRRYYLMEYESKNYYSSSFESIEIIEIKEGCDIYG